MSRVASSPRWFCSLTNPVVRCRVLNRGNSLKWHYEVFRWLDEWVGEDAEEVKAKRAGEWEGAGALRVQA